MPDPKLTILTTVYNGERYLEEAIESVLDQDFTDYEYVIVDDGSTDDTPRILQRLSERDPRIVVVRLPQNGGHARALNRGLAVARGQYIGRQDADDICVGRRLRRQVEQLDSEPDVALVSANYTLIDTEGRWAGNCVVENPPAVIAYLLNFSNSVGGASSQGMFRRDMARELGGFREDAEGSEDYEFWTRLVQRGRFVILPFIGLKYRVHDQQISARLMDTQQRNSLMNSRRMLTSYLERALSDDEFDAIASIWRQQGRTGVAATGNRLMREAYARFAEGNAVHCDLVRRITAHRWVHSAVPLIKKGAFADAARHLAYAVMWHRSSIGASATVFVEQMFVRVRRMRLWQ